MIASALIAAGPLIAAAPASANPTDDAFVGALDNAGIPYQLRKDAVKMAKRVCSLLGAGGDSALQEAASYLNSEGGYSQDQMMAFGSAAVAVYCPKNAP